MLIGVSATICAGYTPYDHLIDSADVAAVADAVADAVAGVEFRRCSDALRAAEKGIQRIGGPQGEYGADRGLPAHREGRSRRGRMTPMVLPGRSFDRPGITPDSGDGRRTFARQFVEQGDTMTTTDLSGADLAGAKLADAVLTGAKLAGANLSNVDLSGADLDEADLIGATLTGADLSEAGLTGADLTGAKLADADLADADLADADLADADLTGADLTGADLDGADLGGARRREDDPPIPGWTLVDGRLRSDDEDVD